MSDDEQIAETLLQAVEMLPDETDLSDFEIVMQGGDFSAAVIALRQAASAYPTPFGFWVLLSKAEQLLGDD